MTQRNLIVSSAAVSDKGLSDKRPQNEDSYLLLQDSGLFAVADGVGGAQAGDVASEMAVEILGEAFINLDENGDAEDRMRAAIEKANAAIYQMSRDLPQLSTMATTLVAIHISGNIATIGHVGDSRLYRLDSAGLLFRETQDHSVVEEEVRAGRMTKEQAKTHPNRNVISRAIGAEETVEIDMKTIMFETNSRFLVCSDGVTRHISDEELQQLLFNEANPDTICNNIKNICFERGAEDNLTAVVIKADAAFEGSTATLEIEEETVATARAGAASGQVFADLPETNVSSGKQSLEAFELDDIEDLDDDDDLDDAEDVVIPTREVVSGDKLSESDAPGKVSNASPINTLDTAKDVKSYRVDENSGGGLVGRVLGGVAWLIVGLLIGALGYFLYATQYASAPADPLEVTNRAVLGLEQQRRLVDADPAKYLATYSTKEDQTAGDHYLVGRAYLLQANYGAAKTSFEKAGEKLSSEDITNREILKHDIAVGLSIAGSEEAQKLLEADSPGSEDSEDAASDTPKGD